MKGNYNAVVRSPGAVVSGVHSAPEREQQTSRECACDAPPALSRYLPDITKETRPVDHHSIQNPSSATRDALRAYERGAQ